MSATNSAAEDKRERKALYSREWYARNRTKHLAAASIYAKKNPGKRRVLYKRWYSINKSKAIASASKWKREHPERIADIRRREQEKNKTPAARSRHAAWKRDWRRRYMPNNPMARIVKQLRESLRRCVREKRFRADRALVMLGCSRDELRHHLESRFVQEMAWENYGSYWEIDHIKPCASFNMLDLSDQRKCFHYTNLQPIRIRDNRVKGARIL